MDGIFYTDAELMAVFHNGGVYYTEMSVDPWITTQEVTRTEILSLPPNIY